ncbi:MAG: metallophosphoesterase [Deltaproteobacteria bacterium]|jgi:predicted MPP superfamily phosphohydrolase|nr:metallophosphoesterase [Deltaproteobacteria bacterium]
MFILAAIVLLVSAFFVPYEFRKLVGRPKRIWPYQALCLLFDVGYLALIASRLFIEPSLVWAGVYDFLGLFFIFQVYLFFLMAVAWLLGLAKKLAWRKKAAAPDRGPTAFSRFAGVAALVLCAALVIYGTARARFFTVTEFEVALPGLDKPVTVVHAPDLHLGNSRGKAYLESVIAAIKSQNPDLVLYNGDLVDSRLALRDDVFGLFKTIPAEQYFTTGNHEYYVGPDLVIDWVKKAGIKTLRSEMVVTHGIQLIGLEYMNADRESSDPHQVNQLAMDEELPKIARSPDLPVVVVHHSPVGLRYVEEGGAAAMLSGHTHGGQLFPGTLMIRSRFPQYRGRYQVGRTTVIVSQGAGTFGPMMRLGTENEIQTIRFLPAPWAD